MKFTVFADLHYKKRMYAASVEDLETIFDEELLALINENDTEEDYVLMIANYEGYFVQMYIEPAEGAQVAEEDITTALAILTSIKVENK